MRYAVTAICVTVLLVSVMKFATDLAIKYCDLEILRCMVELRNGAADHAIPNTFRL